MSERTKEIALTITKTSEYLTHGAHFDQIARYLDTLPEFQEQKWVKCSERMPPPNEPIYYATKHFSVCASMYSCELDTFANLSQVRTQRNEVTHWMPRFVPEPPAEEDSELVKKIRGANHYTGEYAAAFQAGLNRAIEVVKIEEKGKK